jgi:hypothetical protein
MRIRVLLAFGAVMLSGCGSGDEGEGSAAADSVAADATSAAVSPSASSDTTGGPALSEHGMGALHVGMTADEARTALGGRLYELPADGETEGCRYARSEALPPGVMIMLDGGVVRRVEVDSGAVATAAGARIGDSEDRIRQLYPGLREQPHKYVDGKYLVAVPGAPADTTHRIVFETDGRVVTRFRGGAFPYVEYVEGCS